MNKCPRILLVGDYSEQVFAHRAIPKALTLCVADHGLSFEWVATTDIGFPLEADGIWVVPNSPYQNMEGVLAAIQFAREKRIPFLGTCGGFQHAVIEYARNVSGLAAADHAESNPNAETPVIAKLRCALINQSESISLLPGSRLEKIYGAAQITEAYQCSYGINPEFEKRFDGGKLVFSASSWDGSPRALELADHPFFFATLFQPERSAIHVAMNAASMGDNPGIEITEPKRIDSVAHPLIAEFVRAAVAHCQSA